jgi:CRP-like cAMP-binding protein
VPPPEDGGCQHTDTRTAPPAPPAPSSAAFGVQATGGGDADAAGHADTPAPDTPAPGTRSADTRSADTPAFSAAQVADGLRLGTPMSHTRRRSSEESMPSGRAYTSWVAKSDRLRRAVGASAGQGVADALVLTGAAKMEGKVTSLLMVSQSVAQQKAVVAALRKASCFAASSTVHLSMLAAVARKRYHARYSLVYREGAPSYHFYVLLSGAVQLSTPSSTEVLRADGKACALPFGTEGVGVGLHRGHSAMCLGACEILHFSSAGSKRLDAAGVEALARETFAMFVGAELRKMPLLHGMSQEAADEVSRMFELRECGRMGEVLYRLHDVADEVYLLVKGRVLLEDADGTVLAKLTAGSAADGYPFFGEASILHRGQLRTDSATTTTPCKLLVLPRCHFARILKLMPFLPARLHEFHELRKSRAELSRQMKEAEAQRQALARQNAQLSAIRGSPGPDGDDEVAAAAGCVTRHARGFLARKAMAAS